MWINRTTQNSHLHNNKLRQLRYTLTSLYRVGWIGYRLISLEKYGVFSQINDTSILDQLSLKELHTNDHPVLHFIQCSDQNLWHLSLLLKVNKNKNYLTISLTNVLSNKNQTYFLINILILLKFSVLLTFSQKYFHHQIPCGMVNQINQIKVSALNSSLSKISLIPFKKPFKIKMVTRYLHLFDLE